LIQAELDAQVRAALVRKFGTARFLNLARRDRPAAKDSAATDFSGSRAFAEKCLQAAAAEAHDPQRLAKLVARLNDASPAVRNAARVDLAATGAAGAAACLQTLAHTDNPLARAHLMLALAPLRPAADALLVAALAEGDGRWQRDAAEASGRLELLDATPWLAALAVDARNDPATLAAARTAITKLGLSQPSIGDARTLLRSEIGRLEAGILPSHLAATDPDVWWWFDASQGQLARRELPADRRQLLALARVGRTLVRLPNATAEDRRIALIYAEEVAPLLGEPLPADLRQLSAAMSLGDLNQTLAQALRQNRLQAAIACAELLGKRGQFAALSSPGGGKPSPLVAALKHADDSVRFAALAAIMQISPRRPFAGASGVPKALWNFAAGAELSRASQALQWVGQLLDGHAPYDELRRDAKRAGRTLYNPPLAAASVRVLALLGTAGSQQALVDFASQRAIPIESRRQAAEAFAASVGRFGILLTTTQILRQYDRYNASETADRDTQQVLGQLLDALESRR